MTRKVWFYGCSMLFITGLLSYAHGGAIPPSGDYGYTYNNGVWTSKNNTLAGNSSSGFSILSCTKECKSTIWSVTGTYLQQGDWESIGLIFAQYKINEPTYAVLYISKKDQRIGLGTINIQKSGIIEYNVFSTPNPDAENLELDSIKKRLVIPAEQDRIVEPTQEMQFTVEVNNNKGIGIIRPVVRWYAEWDPTHIIEVEMRRFQWPDPANWTPLTGWVLNNGKAVLSNTDMAAIPAGNLFTDKDPKISYSLNERLLQNIGFYNLKQSGKEIDHQAYRRYNVFTPSDSITNLSKVYISAFQYSRVKDCTATIKLEGCHSDDVFMDRLGRQITSYTFKPEDKGSVAIPVRWSTKATVHKATITDTQIPLTNYQKWSSNWAKVNSSRPDYILVWGDFHAHSAKSFDATGTVEHFFDHAMNGAFLEFSGPSDHSEFLTDDEWISTVTTEEQIFRNNLLRFVPLPGYEWTSAKFGHNNVYFYPKIITDATDGKTHWAIPPLCRSTQYGNVKRGLDNLSDFIKTVTDTAYSYDTIIIPHHPGNGRFPTDWRFYYKDCQPVTEIISWWGSSEVYGASNSIFVLTDDFAGPGHYVRDALAHGLKLGFVGGSDTHEAQPGYDTHTMTYGIKGYKGSVQIALQSESQYGGLTGLYVKELSLGGIFEAFRARRSMASSNERRIRTDLKINGHWQGEEYTADPNTDTTRNIHIEIMGQDDFEYIQIIKNGVLFKELPVSANKQTYTWDLKDAETLTGTTYYYVRVRQVDSAEGFSSPIWVNYMADSRQTPIQGWSVY